MMVRKARTLLFHRRSIAVQDLKLYDMQNVRFSALSNRPVRAAMRREAARGSA